MAHDEEYCSSLASVRSNSDESEGEFHDSEMEAEVAHNCYSSTTHLQNDDILSERYVIGTGSVVLDTGY